MTVNVKMTNGGSDSVNFVNDAGTTLAQVKGYDDGSSNGHLEFYTNTSGTVSEKVRVQNGLHIQQDSSSNNRLVFRGQPSSSYRWNIDNYGSSNQMRFFRENDADASGGSVMMTIDSSGIVTGTAGNLMLVRGTAVASTSGSTIGFTGIPSWAKRITVMLQGVSGSALATLYMQVGTSGGYVASGYLGQAMYIPSTASINANTYWPLEGATIGAAALRSGNIVLTNITGNTWVLSGNQGNSGDSGSSVFSGNIALGAALDRVQIGITSGTFDAGNINILYE